MAVSTSALLEAAGIAPKQYGTMISTAAVNRSVFLRGGGKARIYTFAPGQEFYIPKGDAMTVTSAAAQPASVNFQAESETKATMVNSWDYAAMEIPQQALDAMDQSRLNTLLMSKIESAGDALANVMDAALLSSYASVGGGPWSGTAISATSGVTADLLAESIGNLRVANARTPFFMVLHENEAENLIKIDRLIYANIRGDGGSEIRGSRPSEGDFDYVGTRISTTNNVAYSTNYRGAAFSGDAFALAIRTFAQVRDEFDINTMSRKLVVYSDFAWACVRPEMVCEVTGQV